jgi:stringent starvation protein B
MSAILEPRYDNLSIYHYKGGHCQLLEEELISNNPPHDDIKDALASAIEIAVKPASNMMNRRFNNQNVVYSQRFGGVAH